MQLAESPPSAVVAVIIALPLPVAVTVPVLSTMAISGLFEVHVTVLFVAFVGEITGVIFDCEPILRITLLSDAEVDSLIPFTLTCIGGTVSGACVVGVGVG